MSQSFNQYSLKDDDKLGLDTSRSAASRAEDKRHESYLKLTRKLTRVSDLFVVLCVLLPLAFLGSSQKMPIFLVFVSFTIIAILTIWQAKYIGSLSYFHSLLSIILLGTTAGLSQLSPIPALVLSFVAVFSLLGLPFFYQITFSFAYFLSALICFLLAESLFGLSQLQNTLLEVSALFGFFFSLSIKYHFLQVKYEDIHKKLSLSRSRFDDFMQIANKLARYTPSQVWQAVIQGKESVKLENKRKKITIFFSDIKGFTDLSEILSPEDLTSFLNEYFEQMSAIAKRHGGTIDKFIGDAMLVFFGDPTSKGLREDALACVEMALDMRREMARLRNHWRGLGFDGLDVRMGINTGYCHVGNFGSQSRLSYTAIGREVNLAARIQSAAEPNEILMSRSTFELVHHNFICEKHGPLQLKGILEPVEVVQVTGIRQGEDKRKMRWLEHDMPGFNLHLNMREIKPIDKKKIRRYLREATHTLDDSIKD